MMADIPHFKLSLDPVNTEESIKPILKNIRSNWNVDEVKFVQFTEGISNKLIGCKNGDEMILFRLYGNKTELFIDRQKELETFRLLHAKGFGPPVHATFDNGIAYGFVPGDVLDTETICDPQLSLLIARHMARLHAVKPDENSRHCAENPVVFETIFKYLKLLPDEFEDPAKKERCEKEVPNKSSLLQEAEMLKSVLLKHGCPIVFCHNDMLCKNIVYNGQTGEMRTIDYEYAGMNYLAYDIGNHFCEYAGVEEVDHNLYPKKEHQIQWLKVYLEETAKIKGDTSPTIPAKDVEKLYFQVNQFALAAHFFWGLWALVQAHFSSIDFDFLGYGISKLNEYFRRKDEFLALTYDSS